FQSKQPESISIPDLSALCTFCIHPIVTCSIMTTSPSPISSSWSFCSGTTSPTATNSNFSFSTSDATVDRLSRKLFNLEQIVKNLIVIPGCSILYDRSHKQALIKEKI